MEGYPSTPSAIAASGQYSPISFGRKATLGAELETQNVMPGTRHGVKPSKSERKFEQYWHKPAAILFATGRTNKQVAEELGLAESTVATISCVPWFQEMVTKIVADNGGKDMLEIFKRDATDAHALLVELRQDPKTPVQYRVKLATDAVERYYGKATQRIETGEIKSADPVAEAARLKKEIELLSQAGKN